MCGEVVTKDNGAGGRGYNLLSGNSVVILVTSENGVREETKSDTTTWEDIGRRSPKLPGWSFYEKMIDTAPRVGHRTAFP